MWSFVFIKNKMTGHICEVEESGNSVCVPAVSVGCIACRTSFFNYLNFFLVCISRSRSSYHVPYTRPRYRVLVLVTQVTIFHLRELVSTWPCPAPPVLVYCKSVLVCISIKKFLDTTITTIPNSTYQYTVALKC